MRLDVDSLSIRLGKPAKRILDEVSFCAEEGEFLSLLGPSGAGKSTILKIIAGILVQDFGSVRFGGESVDGLPAHRRQIGFVFQDMRLFPHMNVEQNVAFPCKMRGMARRERLMRARYLLTCVQLDGFGSREVASLSGGQQQRVALARALAAHPRVLLLDEPFSGLDENLRDEIRSLVLKLHRDFTMTTIMVTHDAVEALEMSDRVVYLSEGTILQKGTPAELYAHPAAREVAACFGECSVLEGVVAAEVFRVAANGGQASEPVASGGQASVDSCGARSAHGAHGAGGTHGTHGAGGLELPAPNCADGPATAVIRHEGVRLTNCSYTSNAVKPLAPEPNRLSVRCCVYRGTGHLARLELAGQTLTAPVEHPYAPGTQVDISLQPGTYFVYPSKRANATETKAADDPKEVADSVRD